MRTLIWFCAALFPFVSALAVVYFSAPADWSLRKQQIKPAQKFIIPDTLEEAKKMAAERLDHLKQLTQTQWEIERQSILNKRPPVRIEEAIERTKTRIEDLNRLSPEAWNAERKNMLRRAGQD